MLVFLIVANCEILLLLIKVDKFDDVGVVDGGSLDEKTIVIGQLFLIASVKLVRIDEFVGNIVFIGGSIDLHPIFCQKIDSAIYGIAHSSMYLYYNVKLYFRRNKIYPL